MIIDLFAGPGGWDAGVTALGVKVTGIERDHAACETRRAAGLATVEGDVRAYGPADFPADYPWSGGDLAQQVGNCVPVQLGRAVLAAATGVEGSVNYL